MVILFVLLLYAVYKYMKGFGEKQSILNYLSPFLYQLPLLYYSRYQHDNVGDSWKP